MSDDILDLDAPPPAPRRAGTPAKPAGKTVEYRLAQPIDDVTKGGKPYVVDVVSVRRVNIGDLLQIDEADLDSMKGLLGLLSRVIEIDGNVHGEPVHALLFERIDADDLEGLVQILLGFLSRLRGGAGGGATPPSSRGRRASAKRSS